MGKSFREAEANKKRKHNCQAIQLFIEHKVAIFNLVQMISNHLEKLKRPLQRLKSNALYYRMKHKYTSNHYGLIRNFCPKAKGVK